LVLHKLALVLEIGKLLVKQMGMEMASESQLELPKEEVQLEQQMVTAMALGSR